MIEGNIVLEEKEELFDCYSARTDSLSMREGERERKKESERDVEEERESERKRLKESEREGEKERTECM